ERAKERQEGGQQQDREAMRQESVRKTVHLTEQLLLDSREEVEAIAVLTNEVLQDSCRSTSSAVPPGDGSGPGQYPRPAASPGLRGCRLAGAVRRAHPLLRRAARHWLAVTRSPIVHVQARLVT